MVVITIPLLSPTTDPVQFDPTAPEVLLNVSNIPAVGKEAVNALLDDELVLTELVELLELLRLVEELLLLTELELLEELLLELELELTELLEDEDELELIELDELLIEELDEEEYVE